MGVKWRQRSTHRLGNKRVICDLGRRFKKCWGWTPAARVNCEGLRRPPKPPSGPEAHGV